MGGKKPKLTKDERIALKQAKKEAARLLKIEKEIQAHKDFLEREKNATLKNEKIVKKKWRDIMKQVRAPSLYDDFVTLRQHHDRLVDMKNQMISDLTDALADANVQYDLNLQNHVDTIDKMLAFFFSRIGELNSWYRSELGDLGGTLSQQKVQIQERQQIDDDHLKVVKFCVDQKRSERAVQVQAETSAKVDEENSKNGQKFEIMQTEQEEVHERQWDELQSALQAHQKATDGRRAEVAVLRAREQAANKLIGQQMRRTQRLFDAIQSQRTFISEHTESDSMKVVRALRDERDDFRSTFQTLSRRMNGNLRHDKQHLATLVALSEAVTRVLEAIVAKGEKIISLASLCRAMETQDEKVDPFPGGEESAETSDDPGASTDANLGTTPGSAAGTISVASSKVLAVTPAKTPAKSPTEPPETAPRVTPSAINRALASPKMQTPEFATPSLPDVLSQTDQQAEDEDEDNLEKVVDALQGLRFFWARAGRVEVSRLQLQRTVEDLRVENEVLQDQLKAYLRLVAPTSWSCDPIPRGPPSTVRYVPDKRGKSFGSGSRTLYRGFAGAHVY